MRPLLVAPLWRVLIRGEIARYPEGPWFRARLGSRLAAWRRVRRFNEVVAAAGRTP